MATILEIIAVVSLLVVVLVAAAIYVYKNPALLVLGMHRLTTITKGLSVKRLVIDDNLSLSYFERGYCSEYTTTVVFVHGLSGSKENMASLATTFSRRKYHLLALDLPGHGASTRTDKTGFTPTYYIQSMKQFLDKLGLTVRNRKVHMVGHSMGGMLTAMYAATYPDDLASVTLIAPSGMKCHLTDALVKEFKASNFTKCSLLPSSEEELSRMLETAFYRKLRLPRLVISGIWQLLAPGQSYYNQVLRVLICEFYGCLEKLLPKIQTPVFVVWGKGDPHLDYKSAMAISENLPKPCEILLLDNCGHAPQIDHPERTAQAVNEFVGKYSEHFHHAD